MAQRFSIIPARALTDPRITDQDLRVLNVLGLHTDKNGWCRPSLSLVAQYLSTPDRQVSYSTAGRRIVRLVQLGYVNSAPRYGRNGERLPNGLQVRFDAPLDDTSAEFEQVGDDTPLQNDAQFGDPPSKSRGVLEGPPPNDAGICKGTPQLNAPSNAPIVSAQKPRAPKTKKPLTPLQEEQKTLIAKFSELTGIPEPSHKAKNFGYLWAAPMLEIIKCANGNSHECVTQAIERLKNDRMTVSSPKSILQTAIAIYGEIKTNGESNGNLIRRFEKVQREDRELTDAERLMREIERRNETATV